MFEKRKPKVGLVLGGGAARGFAHIGVIKVLERNNIPIDFIAGSSIGALVGGLYAVTKDIGYVEELALNTNWKKIPGLMDPAFGSGILTGDKVKDFIHQSLKGGTFGNSKIPFAAVATDMKTAETVVFDEGDLSFALRASTSIPFIFHTVAYKDKILCDGDLSMPVPVSVARKMGAEYIIAVDLRSHYFDENRDKIGTNFGDMGQDVEMLLASHLARENIRDADFVLSPKLSGIKWMEFFSTERTKEIIARGELAMTEALPKLFPEKKEKTFFEKLTDFFTIT